MENKLIDTMPTEISVVEEPQINIYGEVEPDVLEKSAWDKSVKVEENGYYWKKDPVFSKGGEIPNDRPIIVELFCG
jgi:DNA (cytosine-5)-methyltransferase 1